MPLGQLTLTVKLYEGDSRIENIVKQLDSHIKSLKYLRREIEHHQAYINDGESSFKALSKASNSVGYIMYWTAMMYYKVSRGHSQLHKHPVSHFTDLAVDSAVLGSNVPLGDPSKITFSIQKLLSEGNIMIRAYNLDKTLGKYYNSSMNDLLGTMNKYVKLVNDEGE